MLASNMLTKDQMLEEYEVLGFFYDLCIVQRRSDGVKGTLQYSSHETENGYTRLYYNFVEE
jgi:hypothetical protein